MKDSLHHSLRRFTSILAFAGLIALTPGFLQAQTFDVTNSTNLTSGTNSYVATYVGNGATLEVLNTNTLLTSGGIGVGWVDSGNSLVISNGGTVSNVWCHIGNIITSSNNSALVTGTNSTWVMSDTLYVGHDGSGNSLVISNGGTVTSSAGHLGWTNTSSNNSVLVTGENSLWTNSNALRVGRLGSDNSLTVAAGGAVAATDVIIAEAVGSSGILHIGRLGTNDAAGTIIAPTIAFGSGAGVINFNQSNATTITSTISGNGAVSQLGAGTTTLSGLNTYNGTTTIAGGTLQVTNLANAGTASAIGTNGTIVIAKGGVLSYAGTTNTSTDRGIDLADDVGLINVSNTAAAMTLSGVISNTGALIKIGAGTLILSANNTYSGASVVFQGDLAVDGAANNSTVVVYNGATLSGRGSIGGIVLNLGGTVSPGNSPGTLNVLSNAVWNPAANYNWQIHNAAGTIGSTNGWDWLNVSGSLDLTALSSDNKFNINLWSLSGVSPDTNGSALFFTNTSSYTWTILTASNGITGFSADKFNINTAAFNGTGGFANALNPGWGFSVQQAGNDLNLVYSATGPEPVPEPGTWAAAALLVGAAGFMRWRKRAKVS